MREEILCFTIVILARTDNYYNYIFTYISIFVTLLNKLLVKHANKHNLCQAD